MDDQASDNSYDQMQNDKSTYPQTIRYHRPHISQEPIDDTEPEYVTRNRYQTLEESQSGRKHMGVAPSESAYLKDAPLSKNSAYNQEQARKPAKQQRREPRPKQTLTHSARYLETPKQGKSIFISSSRRRKQHRLFFTTTKFRISRLISFGFHRFAKVPHPFFANCPIFPSSRLPRTFCSARRTQPADHDA